MSNDMIYTKCFICEGRFEATVDHLTRYGMACVSCSHLQKETLDGELKRVISNLNPQSLGDI